MHYIKGLTVFKINSLWPTDAIWWQGSRSTLVQVIACCLMAPSHYLRNVDLSYLRSSDVRLRAVLLEISQPSVTKISLKMIFLRFYWVKSTSSRFPRINLYKSNRNSFPFLCRMLQASQFRKIPITTPHCQLLGLEVLYLWNALPACPKESITKMLESKWKMLRYWGLTFMYSGTPLESKWKMLRYWGLTFMYSGTPLESKWKMLRYWGLTFMYSGTPLESKWKMLRYWGLTFMYLYSFNSLAPGRPRCLFKTAIFNLILLIGIFTSSKDNALRWMPRDLTDNKSTLVKVMAWCRQATSHYLSQCWPRSGYTCTCIHLNIWLLQ